MSPQDQDLKTKAARVVEHLRSIGIRMVAIDFDRTILKIHTGGVWRGTLEELQQQVRPELATLIQTIDRYNKEHEKQQQHQQQSSSRLHMAVVTFSGQVSFVGGVLQSILPESYQAIPIRGEDDSWREPHPNLGWWPADADVNYDSAKQSHMLSAWQALESKNISKEATVLIDDDAFNVQVAKTNGVRGVVLYPQNPGKMLNDLLELK
jgi:predicted HAD superfamily phosphohydrolase YqeG